MKRMAWMVVLMLGLTAGTQSVAQEGPRVKDLTLEGRIKGENIIFDLNVILEGRTRELELPLVAGDVVYLDGSFPERTEIQRKGDQLVLVLTERGRLGRGEHLIHLRFASRPVKQGDWRETTFSIPLTTIRKLAVVTDRKDYEVRFPGALNTTREPMDDGHTMVSAFLGAGRDFRVRWKPDVRRLDAELVVSSDAHTVATASVGAMRLDSVYNYRIIQGELKTLRFTLPEVNIIHVGGADIQDWRTTPAKDGAPSQLVVTLSRPQSKAYQLRVTSEMPLPTFPCETKLPVLTPGNVIRASGFLLLGTDSAIKLQIQKAAGLTQIDQTAFPKVAVPDQGVDVVSWRPPTRSTYAYQYASTPYTLAFEADDIVTSYTVDGNITASLRDDELTFHAALEVDVRDAPARELRIEVDPDPAWTVTEIAGKFVSEADADVRIEEGKRILYVPLTRAIRGPFLVTVQLESSLDADASSFTLPHFSVPDAKAERGYVVIAAERGIRLKPTVTSELREVHTASAPMNVVGAQQAFRYKHSGWTLGIDVERRAPAVHSEVFHLASLGEGVMYCSAAVTYHISGAPLQEFKIRVPTSIESVEFTGADIEGWRREGDICTIRLQARVMGDYTLLATYDQQYDYEGDTVVFGDIEPVGVESEVGYIAVSSSASLQLIPQGEKPKSIIEIDRSEIPEAYASPVNDPIIGSFKYVHAPHPLTVRVEPFTTQALLEQIGDYVEIDSRVSRKGGTVTTATYYLKNASRQYLVVRLPADAQLWTIKHVAADGVKTDALSQERGDDILIPVDRPRDPNTPICVEVVYAQEQRELGLLSTGLRPLHMTIPHLPDTHATFVRWHLSVPESFAISKVRSPMVPDTQVKPGGLGGVLRQFVRLGRAVVSSCHSVPSVFRSETGGRREVVLTQSVHLSASGPLKAEMGIVPSWVGARSSVQTAAVAGVAALVLLILSLKVRRPIVPALGLSAITVALASFGIGRTLAGAGLWLLLGVLFAIFMFRWGFRIIFSILKLAWRLVAAVLRMAVDLAVSGGRATARVAAASRNRWRESCRRRRERREAKREEDLDPFEPAVPHAPMPQPEDGCIRLAWLVVVGIMMAVLGLMPVMAQNAELPVLDMVKVFVDGPKMDEDTEQSAAIRVELESDLDAPVTFMVIPAGAVLTEYSLSNDSMRIEPTPNGYALRVGDAGHFKATLNYRIPLAEANGLWSLPLSLLPNMRNVVAISLPQPELEIAAPQAVLFTSETTATKTFAEAVFGPTRDVIITWKPRVRMTKLEEAVFFTEVSTFSTLRPGLIDNLNRIRFRIAQGEIRDIRIRIPDSMSVTAVRAENLATWSFDPETRLLDTVLEAPVSGVFSMDVSTQATCDGLPYDAKIGVISVLNTARQRGSLAIGAQDAVQVQVGDTASMSPINLEDVSSVLVQAATGSAPGQSIVVRRAFRYHDATTASVDVHTEQVMPEVRVQEVGQLELADERMMLATTLALNVVKSGIFSADIKIPSGFDVETLSGSDVSHWDERDVDGRRVITVNFSRRVTDTTRLDLTVARMQRGIDAEIEVPRVEVIGCRKHRGRITLSGERGVRMMVGEHRGVDILKASEAGIHQAGVLVFDILRPNWEMKLRTDVLSAQVKADILQWVDLSEGMLQCRAFVRYSVENAGVKSFLIQSPEPGVTLSVSGRNIARVHQVNPTNGVWQIDLQGKVERAFDMTVNYQVPFNHNAETVVLRALRTLETQGQRGYLVVTCGGRVQVTPTADPSGLKLESPRNIPAVFKAGDLSDAILCYRAVKNDYALPLNVVRHASADVLPARVKQVSLTSVLSPTGKLLTRLSMDLSVGDLRFLRTRLPSEDCTLWTVLVNGREVAVSRNDGDTCIPLDVHAGGEQVTVEMIYAGGTEYRRAHQRWHFLAPTFRNLPLSNVSWTFYAPPGMAYGGFGGTMDPVVSRETQMRNFGAADYMQWNRERRVQSIAKAEEELNVGQELAQQGNQKEAKLAFQQALNYSAGQADLNEDARVQLRNVTKQQFKMGLINRRGAVRFRNNIMDQPATNQQFDDGQFTPQAATVVEQGLSAKDNTALDLVADKMIEQQAAAAGVVSAINIIMPTHGQPLEFARQLQVDPEGELSVVFHARQGSPWALTGRVAGPALLFLALWGLLSLKVTRRRPAAA